jgi:hypothetical protein
LVLDFGWSVLLQWDERQNKSVIGDAWHHRCWFKRSEQASFQLFVELGTDYVWVGRALAPWDID